LKEGDNLIDTGILCVYIGWRLRRLLRLQTLLTWNGLERRVTLEFELHFNTSLQPKERFHFDGVYDDLAALERQLKWCERDVFLVKRDQPTHTFSPLPEIYNGGRTNISLETID
jgi:hypothetical protein